QAPTPAIRALPDLRRGQSIVSVVPPASDEVVHGSLSREGHAVDGGGARASELATMWIEDSPAERCVLITHSPLLCLGVFVHCVTVELGAEGGDADVSQAPRPCRQARPFS